MTNTSLQHDIPTRLRHQLTERLGQTQAGLWLDAGTTLDYLADDATLRVAAPSKFVADRLRRPDLATALREVAADVLGRPVKIDITLATTTTTTTTTHTNADDAPAPAPATATGSHGHTPPPNTPTAQEPHDDFSHDRFTPPLHTPAPRKRKPAHPFANTGLRHHLDDYIVGPANQLAFAAAERLADADPSDHAVCGVPLFIHGPCGMGKTHLLQGICRRWIQRRTGGRILYTTGEQFTNRYIEHAQRGTLDAFRKAMRHVGLLAIDDIHFIAGKNKTQTEFLHCFDAIELCGAPIVLASDQHPRQIKQFTEALSSRCLRGLVVEVAQPDTATRRKLFAALGLRQNLILQPAALDTLAREAGPSVREIEGVLRQLHALATLTPDHKNTSPLGVSVGMDLVNRLLSHQRQQCPPKPASVPTIIRTVAERFALSPRQILGNGRQRAIVLARSITAHLARQLTPMSYPEVAVAMGRPNHSSVISADKRIKKMLTDNTAIVLPGRDDLTPLREALDDLIHAIRQAD